MTSARFPSSFLVDFQDFLVLVVVVVATTLQSCQLSKDYVVFVFPCFSPQSLVFVVLAMTNLFFLMLELFGLSNLAIMCFSGLNC